MKMNLNVHFQVHFHEYAPICAEINEFSLKMNVFLNILHVHSLNSLLFSHR